VPPKRASKKVEDLTIDASEELLTTSRYSINSSVSPKIGKPPAKAYAFETYRSEVNMRRTETEEAEMTSQRRDYNGTEDDESTVNGDERRFIVGGRRFLVSRPMNDTSNENDNYSCGSIFSQHRPVLLSQQANINNSSSTRYEGPLQTEELGNSMESTEVEKFFRGYAIPEQARIALMNRISMDLTREEGDPQSVPRYPPAIRVVQSRTRKETVKLPKFKDILQQQV